MRVLYLRTDICRDNKKFVAGGSIAHMQGVLEGLGAHDVTVIAFSSRSIFKHVDQYEIKNLQLPRWTFFLRKQLAYVRWRLDSFYSSLSFFIQIIKNKDAKKCTVIYQRYSILNCTGILLKKYFSIPLILEYNGSEAYWFAPSKHDSWYVRWFAFGKLSYAVEKINLRFADHIVVVSQVLADDLLLKGVDSKKIIVNPNGVNQNIFNKDSMNAQRESLRCELGIQDKYVFGFIGTFGHWHGINILRDIIPDLVRNNKNIHFLLIGDGVLKADIEQYFQDLEILDAVTFTGIIEQAKAPEYLAVCDAYLCPTQPNPDGTKFFGSPTKLFEYMSMARPIIASDLEQVGEIVSPSFKIAATMQTLPTVTTEVGFTINPLDRDAWIRACQLCYEMSEQEKLKMGQNARDKVLQNYTWKQHVQKIIDHII